MDYSHLLEKKNLHETGNNLDSLDWIYEKLFAYHDLYGELDSAIYYLNRIQTIYSTKDYLEPIAETCLKLKELYMAKADYASAMDQVFKALEIYHASNDLKGISDCYSHLCELMYYEENYTDGVSYCDQAISIQKELDIPDLLSVTYNRKAANLLFIDGELENALNTINLSIAILEKSGETDIPMMASRNTRGDIYKAMKRYDEALADYWYNYRTSMTRGIFRHAIPALGNIGQIYILRGDFVGAIPYKLEAIQIINDTGYRQYLWENYLHLSYCYEQLQQYDQALRYHKLYAVEYSDYQKSMIERLEHGLKIKYETGKKEETIYLQATRISQQKKIQVLYISIAGLLVLVLAGMFFSTYNIRTKQKALELLNVQLDSRNKQNELLMKEIHHRVKNNLEMVKSLISLQSAQLQDSELKDVMIASQNRIQSMGIIHQKLYQGKSLVSIEMRDYFIKLGEGILDTFNANEKVHIQCAMDAIELDIDNAVPLGLIVNELLTNSLKYAFPDGGKGIIQIQLSKLHSDTLSLIVSDNGIGKGNGISYKGTGFGYQLIGLLTQQLNGEMQENNTNGTHVTFRFKLNNSL